MQHSELYRFTIGRIARLSFVISLAVIFFILDGNCQEARDTNVQPQNLDIYLVIGQSNMAGRAQIELQDQDTLEGVFLFKGEKGDEWEKAANPLNKYSTIRKDISMQRLGPGYTFARNMAAASKNQIGLVVNAKGGTSINLWSPGSDFYNEAVKRTKAVLKFGSLKGIIWHQGESDASKYATYANQIIMLMEALRKEFDQPNLPVVVGQLSPDKEHRIPFNEMIIKLPNKIKNVAVARTDGTSTFDSTHFDSKSQRLLGERYAKEMMMLLDK
ncbi:MAG: sialate O-acetylesterase [Cyclobacteriaceae bacterium]